MRYSHSRTKQAYTRLLINQTACPDPAGGTFGGDAVMGDYILFNQTTIDSEMSLQYGFVLSISWTFFHLAQRLI